MGVLKQNGDFEGRVVGRGGCLEGWGGREGEVGEGEGGGEGERRGGGGGRRRGVGGVVRGVFASGGLGELAKYSLMSSCKEGRTIISRMSLLTTSFLEFLYNAVCSHSLTDIYQ